MQNKTNNGITERPPVVVVTGHIDHGKSSLLDYIRKTNVVLGEAGGITQRLSAYEVNHKTDSGEKKITFLDTPGHAAFTGMRNRGVKAADVAILIISAEDSVKAQTIEAIKSIKEDDIPFIVAINKIDKPSANPEKVKMDLAEADVLVEGYGGNVPCILISAKTGQGIPELLDMILLVAEMEELTGDLSLPADGFVIESHLDQKRGISATLLIKNGVLEKGTCVVADDAIAPARIMEDFTGKTVQSASFSSPVTITGFSKLPRAGASFKTYGNKKEAESAVELFIQKKAEVKQPVRSSLDTDESEEKIIPLVPLIVKADVGGTLEAIEGELSKISKEGIRWKIIQKGVGSVTDSDVKLAAGLDGSILIAFNVKTEKAALELALRNGIEVHSFNIIYKLTEWIDEELEKRKPQVTVEETTGTAKILKCFSRNRDKQVVGGKVLSGALLQGASVKIMRREFEIGRGKIMELQQQKMKAKEVAESAEFGVLVESKTEIAPGDTLESYVLVTK